MLFHPFRKRFFQRSPHDVDCAIEHRNTNRTKNESSRSKSSSTSTSHCRHGSWFSPSRPPCSTKAPRDPEHVSTPARWISERHRLAFLRRGCALAYRPPLPDRKSAAAQGETKTVSPEASSDNHEWVRPQGVHHTLALISSVLTCIAPAGRTWEACDLTRSRTRSGSPTHRQSRRAHSM